MPPQGNPAPRAADLATLWKWVAAGAPEPVAPTRRFKSLVDVLESVKKHLDGTPPEHRPWQRYFTLHTRFSHPQTTAEDLRLERAALSKALNSLHWKPRITLPKPLDVDDTVFAVDLRDLGWDDDDLWQEVMAAYPYGLAYRNARDEKLAKLDEFVRHETGCNVPLVRADWFVATATRPPLYHALLFDNHLPALKQRRIDPASAAKGNPKKMTRIDLEDYLQVRFAANFQSPQPDRIAYAGFARSGVSGQNRHLARLEATFGAYWLSNDFKPGSPRSNLALFPNGPRNLFPAKQHPHDETAFQQDGGEAIFNLPCGLQGYLLIDGQGNRIDEGPIEVVSDALKTSGTPAIVNGVSCMSCHKLGMIDFTDTVRDHSALFGEPLRQVQRLYPPADVWERLAKQDRQRFVLALSNAMGRFLVPAGNPANAAADTQFLKAVTETIEPVGEVSRRYRLGFVDLATAASELDFEKTDQFTQAVGARRFKELGIEVLTQPNGVISRLDWETGGTRTEQSLMQKVAAELGFTPVK